MLDHTTSFQEMRKAMDNYRDIINQLQDAFHTTEQTIQSVQPLTYYQITPADYQTTIEAVQQYQKVAAETFFTTWQRLTQFSSTGENDVITSLAESLSKRELEKHYLLTQPEQELAIPDTRIAILPYSPILAWLEKLLYGEIKYNAKSWRQFEEAIAELLEKDGYHVILGPGRKDGGQDLIATKEDPVLGFITSIWQAKMLAPGNKVEVGIVRDLAGTCILNGTKTTKGVIVTTTHLTKDALLQVEQDHHLLGKRDRDDLLQWINQVKKWR